MDVKDVEKEIMPINHIRLISQFNLFFFFFLTKFGNELGATILQNIFLMDVNFDKFTIKLYFLFIYSMHAKFLED